MRVLVLGSGGREHAIVRALAADPSVTGIVAAPGNPGMAAHAAIEQVKATDPAAVVALAQRVQADLVVIGPEAPLVVGVADALRDSGIRCFGPSAAAARLEGSKAFAKEVMESAGVATAEAAICQTEAELDAALDRFGPPYVVKDDGLASGKGVIVTDDRAAARTHGCAGMGKGLGAQVVVEEFLDGPELSVFCLCDGNQVVAFEAAQDYKRVHDGNAGPNTGGMGTYSPLPWAPTDVAQTVAETIAQPIIDEMACRGTPFVGVLFCGLARTARGLKVIEFNTRFGDPETQVILARLRSPLGQVLMACATGDLASQLPLNFVNDAAVAVVLAARDYPATPRVGDVISGELESDLSDDVYVIQAGTTYGLDGQLQSAGGRVLAVVALGESVPMARQKAYGKLATIQLDGGHYRTDIAAELSL